MITGPIIVEEPAVVGQAPGTALPAGPPGASAYAIAVDNGFEGTADQWLAQLQGPPADPRALNAATATAVSSATSATASATAATAAASSTAADRTAVHGDRVQADADVASTAADRTATHADRLAADASATSASSSATSAAVSAAAAATSAAVANGGGPIPSGGFAVGHVLVANNITGTSYIDGGAPLALGTTTGTAADGGSLAALAQTVARLNTKTLSRGRIVALAVAN